ncbi:MAG TPA: proprotein convertase P-domain-containing protein, partial [Candidatus Polarisedimenticolaceae bacterium]|nr:proprotein convertase P-domain-containing protein [Candidatus Polarisedimenticolaceae bacterium]
AGWVFLRGAGAGDIRVPIDILPGEARNIVDPESPEPVAVAILASPVFDPRSIVPESVRLAGAAIVKRDDGATHAFEDADGDGRLDLVVWFRAGELRLGDETTSAVLTGWARDGRAIEARDAVRTLASARLGPRARHSNFEEKLRPLRATIAAFERAGADLVAVLSGGELDPRTLVLDSLRVNGRPVGKLPGGEVVSLEDVNGDGRDDLVVAASGAGTGSVSVNGTTAEGRLVTGSTDGPAAQAPADEIVPIEVREPVDLIRKQFPGAIAINDFAPASPYPATINVSGVSGVVSKVRITLKGVTHTCFNDIDVLLVAPSGQSLVLMSDVGSCGNQPFPIDLVLDDFALTSLSPSVFPPFEGGSFRPSNTFGGDTFAAPAPTPSGSTRLNAFHGIDPNGDWKLYVVDDLPADTGSIAGGWALDIVTMKTFCDTSAALIPQGAPGTTSGSASVYPYQFDVSMLGPLLSKVSVTLKGLSHEKPEDLRVRLQSPEGTEITLMANTGGSFGISGLTLAFDDEAYAPLLDAGPIGWSGSFQPEAVRTGLPSLESLRGSNPNGVWKLWVDDVASGGTGSLSGGACINISTIVSVDACQMMPIQVPAGAPGSTAGSAFPYPSELTITGVSGLVHRVELKLLGLTHTYPDDLDIVLESPSNKAIMLMSDSGGSSDVAGQDVAFELGSSVAVPDDGPLGAGPYAPTDREPGDSIPPLAPQPPFAGTLFGDIPNGAWKLWVFDDAGADWGTIAGWCLDLDVSEPYLWACADGQNPLQIPATGAAGPAGPYPSNASAWQDGTVVNKVTVYVDGLTHSYPDDMDILLVGPRGQKVMLMSDAGGAEDIALTSVVFDDSAPDWIPNDGPMTNGRYQPSNYAGGDTDSFPAPAPPGPYSSDLSDFNGSDPHGFWNLFVMDDTDADTGTVGHWCVKIDPRYPAGDAANLRWLTKTSLAWDGAPNATYTAIQRGTQVQIAGLLDGNIDSCTATVVIQQTATGFDAIPAPGTFFWYLATGVNGGTLGPTGTMRIEGAPRARNTDFIANCPAP